MAKLLALVKIRSFSNTIDQAWLQEWTNPLASDIPIPNAEVFVEAIQRPFTQSGSIIDIEYAGPPSSAISD